MSSSQTSNRRPALAIVSNCLTPYRVHLHELIASGIPELELHSLVTHDDADFSWKQAIPKSIRVVELGQPGDSPLAGPFAHPLREWRKGGRLIRYLKPHNVAAVICNGYRYVSYLRLIQHCHNEHVPLFVNNDSNIRSEPNLSPATSWAKRCIYRWWLSRVAGVMPMGALGDEFFEKYGGDRKKFYRVPYTPDYSAFASVDEERLRRFREEYGLCSERRYLMFSGRLAHVKRVDLVIDAFAQVATRRPEWDLLIVGDGPLRERLRARWRARARTSLAERVVWTGFLEQEELRTAYHAASVLVLPSDREPWAVVVQEAMAAGLVVVATDVVGAACELIVDGESGRLVPTNSVSDLCEAILDVTDTDRLARYQEQSQQALARWRNRVDPVAEIRRALVDQNVLDR